MRIQAVLRALVVIGTLAGAASCSLVLGIGDPSLDPAGGTGGKGGSGATASQSSGAATTASGTGGGGPVIYPCTPTDPSCSVVKSDCLALVDNTSKSSFALRVGQLNFAKPDAFTGGIQKAAFLSTIAMNLPQCYLKGSGTFSWIVNFDKTAGTYQVGAAKPPVDPHDGYSYVNETITIGGQMFPITPASGAMTIGADGTIHAATLPFILLPVYLDAKATNIILVPLHDLLIKSTQTKLSADQNCIGSYNAAGLKKSDGCLPDVDHDISSFIDGGHINGYITLEEADNVIITSYGLNRSLCVLLSNSAGQFGDGGSPAKCKRDSGKIRFNGDMCTTSGPNGGPGPADGVCYDASSVSADFAASAVELK